MKGLTDFMREGNGAWKLIQGRVLVLLLVSYLVEC